MHVDVPGAGKNLMQNGVEYVLIVESTFRLDLVSMELTRPKATQNRHDTLVSHCSVHLVVSHEGRIFLDEH